MMKNIIEQTGIYIRKHGMIRAGDTVITGVSGGADSVCLLFILSKLQKKLGFEIKACHVNHGIRGEAADADEAYVKQLCENLRIPCRFFHENVEWIAKKRKQSPEEAGRMVRREAFETMCREDGGTKIATAHHRDDNAETVLLNIARGTGLKGLCGIRPVQGKWIRPLLGLDREQIENLLTEQGIRWCTDATNEEDAYTRNRIRHNILPVLKSQVNEGVVRHLEELSVQAQEVWEYLEKGIEAAWERVCGNTRTGRAGREEPDAGARARYRGGPRVQQMRKFAHRRSPSETGAACSTEDARERMSCICPRKRERYRCSTFAGSYGTVWQTVRQKTGSAGEMLPQSGHTAVF